MGSASDLPNWNGRSLAIADDLILPDVVKIGCSPDTICSMERGLSILMSWLLVLTFVQTPFQHLHHHEDPPSHPHSLFHTHLHLRDFQISSRPEVSNSESDDDVQYQEWYSVESPIVPDLTAFVSAAVFTFESSNASLSEVEPHIEGGHDPPVCPQLSPRSPPA